MRIIKAIQLSILSLLCLVTYGQDEVDALRFSRNELYGSARYTAMGGAFGALGSDLSVMSQNPAGIALFRRNEFSFSFDINNMRSTAQYYGNSFETEKTTAGFNHVGLVSTKKTKDDSFRRVAFGIGYNRLANYNNSYTFEGVIEGSTLLDVLVGQAQGVHPDDLGSFANTALYAGPAYETYLINPTEDDILLYNHEIPSGKIDQKKTISTTGKSGEVTVNGGANINEKIFIGGSLGFPSIKYTERNTYSETPLNDSLELNNFTYKDKITVSGSGINLKIGIIGKINDYIRVGAAVHTRSTLSMSQSKISTFNSSFTANDTLQEFEYTSSTVDYNYILKTPAKFQFNTAFIIKKLGLIAIDYEYIDYGNAQLSSTGIEDDYNFSNENSAITNSYQGTHNLKIGAEWRVIKPAAVRAGVNYAESPFKNEINGANSETITYSGGIGYRHRGFYADFAYSLSNTQSTHFAYDPNLIEGALLDKKLSQSVITIGFRY